MAVKNFVPRLQLQSYRSSNLPDWYKKENQQNANPYSSMNGRGNCVWYAFGRFSEVKGSWASHSAFNGDAGNWWYANKSSRIYQFGTTPAVGAVACWGKVNGGRDWGHVAIVEQVISNTKFVTSESGYNSYWFKTCTRTTTSKISGGGGTYKFLGFIYNPGGGTGELGDFSPGEVNEDEEEFFGLNAITFLPYGQEIATEMQKHLGESGKSANEGDWGVDLLYQVFKDCALDTDCFNLKALGAKQYWSYDDAYEWLMRNGTFIYDYTSETEEYLIPNPDLKMKDQPIKKTVKVNNIDDFLLADIGDIVFLAHGNNDYSQFDGIGVVISAPKGNTITMVAEYLGTVVKTSRHMSTVHTIIRPPYGVIEGGIRTPEYADILSSSQNYDYIYSDYDVSIDILSKDSDTSVRKIIEEVQKSEGPEAIIPDTERTINLLNTRNKFSSSDERRTRFEGEFASTAKLPTPLTPIEAPYISVIIGGVEIGTYKGKDAPPNYINGLVVKRTNNSLNEYTLSLIHQVSPGDNPNYIDELLSVNSYEEITINYGDAEGGVSFRSVKALLTDVHTSFDFVNCNINYVISATSSAAMSVSYRTNYSSTYNKPSTIIRNLISTDESIKNVFPLMTNSTYVDSNNLIPNTDVAVNIPALNNITPLNYVRELTNYMTSSTSKSNTKLNDSTYVFYIDDNVGGSYFKIAEINTSDNISTTNIAYEVDVGYPDDAQVFDFRVDNDYAWAMSYNYKEGITKYNYDIDNSGKIVNSSSTTLSSNWWTKMTEMPISATLTTRGLIYPMLLMTYIKINCAYYGSQRISSGIYVVTGQTDRLDKNGFRTELSLLRVAGANQYLNIDGRVET